MIHISIEDAASQLARDAGALTAICRYCFEAPEACVSTARREATRQARTDVLDIALRMEKLSVALTQTRLCDLSVRITQEAWTRIDAEDSRVRKAISDGGGQ